MPVTKITAGDVEEWLLDNYSETPQLDGDLVDRVIDAVYAHGTRHYDLEDAGDDTDAERDQALIMESARLYQRKHSQNGYVGSDELGAVRVLIFDHDVRRLLSGRMITAGLFGPSENTAEV